MCSITKLSKLPISVQNLQKTGIGRVVNSLRKYDGDLGEAAKVLVIKWKNVVKKEESENLYQQVENSDEEPHDVSSTTDGLQINQSIISNVASTSYYNNSKNIEPESSEENNVDSSEHESSRHRHHEKSKSKKSKKDKDGKKRKESNAVSTDDQEEASVSKKVKNEFKCESVKIKKEAEEIGEVSETSRRVNSSSSEEYVKKDKKSSHSDKKNDKHRSTHKSESKYSYKEKSQESKSSHKDRSESKKNRKDKTKVEEEPSTSSSCSNTKTFEEALLGIQVVKKKPVKSKCRDRSSRSSSSERNLSPASTSMQLEPLNLDPEELIANYKPLPQLDRKLKRLVDDTDPLMSVMMPKNKRTKVYSGNKSTFYTVVPNLIDLCRQIIKENIDALEYSGGVPFEILEPILKQVSSTHLYRLENYNPYLIEDTGELWEFHCKKEFRNKVPEKNETWRDFYIRCLEEREIKLAKLRHNINANQAASTPVRKTQLAYVDSVVKPPRNVAKKQAKNYTPSESKRNILNKSMLGGNSTADAMSAINRSTTMATGVPIAVGSTPTTSSQLKKKKAPLMQKALQLIKSRYKR